MERIYDWLLHNVEDQGNYLTILNIDRQTEANQTVRLEVMARTKDIEVVNLHIYPTGEINPDEPEPLAGRPATAHYLFPGEDGVIAYLADGATDALATDSSGIRVQVFEPTDDSDQIIFPQE